MRTVARTSLQQREPRLTTEAGELAAALPAEGAAPTPWFGKGFSVLRIIAAALVLSTGHAGAQTAPIVAPDFTERLNRAVERDEIDRGQADVYALCALFAPERLPPGYLWDPSSRGAARVDGEAAPPSVIRCGTPILRTLLSHRRDWRAEVRTEAEGLLTRARVLSGDPTRSAGKTTAEHILPNWIETANFSVEWAQGLTNEDGTSPLLDSNANGVPDVVELWAGYLEASFGGMAKVLHLAAPESIFKGTAAESDRITVLLQKIAGGIYGFTEAGADGLPPVIALNSDFSFIQTLGIQNGESKTNPQDKLADIHGAMKVTAAHELFHVIHFLYQPAAAKEDFADDWWWEASSTWMEDEIFDEVDDYLQYFRAPKTARDNLHPGPSESEGWVARVESGLLATMSSPASRLYGGVIFPKYLSEHVGGRASMEAIWELIRAGSPALPALDQYARAQGFDGVKAPAGVEGLYLGFAGSNAAMEREYEEGARYGSVPIRGESLDAEAVTQNLPAFLGSTYRRGTGSGEGLQVALQGAPARNWGLSLLVKRSAPDRDLVLGLLDPGGAPSLVISSPESGAAVTAAVSLLDAGQPPASYSIVLGPSEAPDITAPGAIDSVAVTPVPSGLDVTWVPAIDDVAVAGYVVRAVPAEGPVQTRTLFGPITAFEIRGLPVQTYAVEVSAYDTSANEGPVTRIEGTAISETASATATPAAALERIQIAAEAAAPEDHEEARGIGVDYGFNKICFIEGLRF